MQKLLTTESKKFNDSCIGFAAETKQCGHLVQFLDEDIMPSEVKNFFVGILYYME